MSQESDWAKFYDQKPFTLPTRRITPQISFFLCLLSQSCLIWRQVRKRGDIVKVL